MALGWLANVLLCCCMWGYLLGTLLLVRLFERLEELVGGSNLFIERPMGRVGRVEFKLRFSVSVGRECCVSIGDRVSVM